MPHLTLEYSGNLATHFDPRKLLLKLNEALLETGVFKEEDIKSRALPLDTFLIGTSLGERAFIHLKLFILSGRPPELKRDISRKLLDVLQDIGSMPEFEVQLCVEVHENDRETYSKENLRI
jgi:5-carboxymethyl-2-hydroxymuconate isomerase